MKQFPTVYVNPVKVITNDFSLSLSQSGLLPTRNSYVECECHRLGEFAVVADVERGFGWSLSGGLVAAFVAVSHRISALVLA